MTTFVRGRTLKTGDATAVVDAGLEVGTHRFQLEVIDSTGRRSAPAVAVVTIQRLTIPVPPVVVPPLRPPSRPPVIPPGPRRNKRSKPK